MKLATRFITRRIALCFDYSYSDSESNKGETFSKCFEKLFFQRIVHEIGLARRLDIVWDRYNPMYVKENPRDKQLSATCDRFCKSSWGLANFFEECLQQIRDFYISIQYAIDRTIAGPKRAVHHKR